MEQQIETSKYKVIGVIPVFDEEGVHTGYLEEGSIQEVPNELGDGWVENGLAEKIVEEENKLEDQIEEEVIEEEALADYKITGILPVFDKLGSAVNAVGIGEIRTYPVAVGESLVQQGLAEKVEEAE